MQSYKAENKKTSHFLKPVRHHFNTVLGFQLLRLCILSRNKHPPCVQLELYNTCLVLFPHYVSRVWWKSTYILKKKKK